MLRRIALIGLAALAAAGCGKKPSGSSSSSGPAVAKGDGFTITADDFKARLEEQSPFVRARYNTLEKKKEFLDNLIRFEVLAREAEKQGLRNDPDVQQTLRKIMVQKLVQKSFNDPAAAAAVPDADVQKFYDEHTTEYHRPKRVRAAMIAFPAAQGSPERAKKLVVARKALAAVQAAEKEKKDPMAFAKLVAEYSEDAATKAASGDLGLKTAEDLEKAYSKELAQAAMGLKQGESSGVVETPQGLYILRATMVQDEMNRTLDQAKPQIVARLGRERKAKEFDEWLKKLRESAKVQIDDKALEAVPVSVAPAAGGAQMPGMMPGMPMNHPPMSAPGGAPPPPPAPAPADK
jgi:peptidyl-prolyl cis-trans isomerase C